MRVFIVILILILLFFHTRGVITHDEGYILQSALRFFQGELPYEDFRFVYTPGSIFLTAFSFLLFSPSILASRILMIAISFATCVLIYKTVLLSTRNKLYSFLAVLLYVAWGPTHVNFSWPVMYCIPLGILVCYLLLMFLETHQERFLFLSGISAFLLFLFKQNFGAAAIIAVVVFFLINRGARKFTPLISFIYGFVWSGILFSLYLFFTNSFASFVNDMYFFTIERILIQRGLDTPFIFYDTLLKTVGRTILYLSPLIASLAALFILLLRKKYHLLFIPTFIGCFYLLGIRPTTDYIHLVPLLSLIGIPTVLFLRFNTFATLRIVTIAGLIGLAVLGFYTALFKGYYRWDEPLVHHNIFYAHPRVNVLVNNKTDNDFAKFISIVNDNSQKPDFILINSYNPMYYFISYRNEPTKNNYLTRDVNAKLFEYEVLIALSQKNIPLVIIPRENEEMINKFIKTRYFYLDSIGDYDVYKQK